MCGILVTAGLNIPFHHRQLKSLRRRGPDEIGFWVDSHVQMAHARLSIIGLDERSTEPLENETHVLSYNGEIYNFIDIRRRLEAEGVHLQDANDAVVLLHAWTRWGKDVLKDLHGFWAFAIYDKRKHTLALVRDQLGIKPLYYWHSGKGVCASSLIRNIAELVPEALDLDYASLSEYVRYQFTFGDKTFFKQVHKVLPGHVTTIDLGSGQVSDTCYEDIFAPADGPLREFSEEWVHETRDLVRECVLESTISDISFTTFCSGGLDSSLITRIAEPEIAYHCNFSDPECNETFYARQVVEGTNTRLFVVNAQEEFNLVERVADILGDFDEPTIGSVILPLEDLLSQVKRRYKVVLTGTGGDELFAGYVRYQMSMGECYQDSYKAMFAKLRKLPTLEARFEYAHRKGDPHLYNFYQPEVEHTFQEAFHQCCNGHDDLRAMMAFDRRYFLAGLLNIEDKMCGRHSLESRPSLLHQKLVRHVKQLDPGGFLRNGELKSLLREVSKGIVPAAVIHRTDKMGFTTPIGTFVNQCSHLVREQVQNSRFRELYNLKKMNLTAETKFSREVFGLLMLDLWLNRYAARPAGRPQPASA